MFDGIDLVFCFGEMMVFVGLIGSGKMMLIMLFMCFYDVMGGRVMFDGVDVCDFLLVEFC